MDRSYQLPEWSSARSRRSQRPRSPADDRSFSILDLQRTAGNGVVTALIQRQPVPESERDRQAKLREDYKNAVDAAGHGPSEAPWNRVAELLNAFDEEEIFEKYRLLKDDQQGFVRRAAANNRQWGRLYRLVQGATRQEETVQQKEGLGGEVLTTHGSYTWNMTNQAIEVDVPIHFDPDPGVTPRETEWLGYIKRTWNHYSAVNKLQPAEKYHIEFNPFVVSTSSGGSASGVHVFQVHHGDTSARSNTGNLFIDAQHNDQVLPHEFGHLIGLADEYEQDSEHYKDIVGEAAPVPWGQDEAKARTIAIEIHDALTNPPDAAHRRAAVDKVLRDHSIKADYQYGESHWTQTIGLAYRKEYSHEMEDDAFNQVPGEVLTSSNGQWREKVFGSFAFSTASVMGRQTEHDHPVEPRHVRRFVKHVQDVMARGDFQAEQDH